MVAKCVICKDPRRGEIEKALSEPRSDAKVSRQFRYSRTTISRHRAHIVHRPSLELPKDLNSSELSSLKAVAQGIVDTADDDKVRIAALRELRGYLELEARLQQEAQGSSSLTTDPAFQALAASLASTLCADCLARVDDANELVIGIAISHAKVEEPIPGGIPAEE